MALMSLRTPGRETGGAAEPTELIFLSFRKRDEPLGVELIRRMLVERFDAKRVFRDHFSMAPGDDFVETLTRNALAAKVMLAIIGPNWYERDEMGNRRIDDPEDWVRKELHIGLRNPATRVVPVLVRDAERLVEADLPSDIQGLARLQDRKIRYRSEQDDITKLIVALEQYLPPIPRVRLEHPSTEGRPAPGGRTTTHGQVISGGQFHGHVVGRDQYIAGDAVGRDKNVYHADPDLPGHRRRPLGTRSLWGGPWLRRRTRAVGKIGKLVPFVRFTNGSGSDDTEPCA